MKSLWMVNALVASVLGLAMALAPTPASAQCCGTVCIDGDGDGAADDALRCQPLAVEGVLDVLASPNRLAGCNDEHPSPNLACIGGEILTGGSLFNGCACLLPSLGGDCFDGSGNSLTPGACAAAAAAACDAASGGQVSIDDAACGSCPTCPTCGDGVCDPAAGEDCSTCEADCGSCCGDGVCDENLGETCETCEPDCGGCGPVCGDDVCDRAGGETDEDCPQDCGCAATGAQPSCEGVIAPGGCTCGPDCGIRNECCVDACDVCGSCGPF